MKLKMMMVCAVLGSLLSATMVQRSDAADIRYISNGDWATASGWQGGVIPGVNDTARMNWGGATVTATSTVPNVGRIQIGVDESGTLEINSGGVVTTDSSGSQNGNVFAGNNGAVTGTLRVNNGGTLNVENILWAANDAAATGVIEINSGGTANVGNHLWLGSLGSATISIGGVLNQTGGILGLGTTNASTPSGGTAVVNILDGGLLALNNIAPGTSIQAGSSINLLGTGQLTVPGDLVGTLTGYAEANQLSGNGVAGVSNLLIDFNTTNPGFTTVSVTAIPEPGSAALLLGLGVSGICARRRKS
ncbi:hypothetical protein LF1_27890 [Rubripirellula obstinata]|uniref:Ice-binding protein C-terminal domain-containing protein n=1 Tax=Rubripirellula obstinata TaxID=406547 RepID=A0A5B1CL48_9BACT|nr:PEP-CTERM sorting domain-containing protein [Rubripirellula obstinata]KAA1260250.1 hypothetical protein LF1_27890 [Rubripirellula obstinata]